MAVGADAQDVTGRGGLGARLTAAVPIWGWVLLACCYAATTWANIVTRTQWVSDSRLYLAWTYRFLGYSAADAAARSRDFLYGMDGVGTDSAWFPSDAAYAYFNGSNGAVAGARPVYPLLSTPFVALLGPNGMLVVPAISLALAIIGTAVLAHRLWGRPWGLIAGLLLMLSAHVSRFGVQGMTEAPSMALTVACLLALPLGGRVIRRGVLWFTVALVVNLCVRQFAMTMVAGVMLAWLVVTLAGDRNDPRAVGGGNRGWRWQFRWRNPWLPYAVAGLVSTILVLKVQAIITAHWFAGGELDLRTRYHNLTCSALHHCGVSSFPWGLKYIEKADYHYVFLDPILLAIIGLFLVGVAWRWRSALAGLAAGSALVTLGLNILVVWPAYYRYYVPMQPLVVLAGLALVARPLIANSQKTGTNRAQTDSARLARGVDGVPPMGLLPRAPGWPGGGRPLIALTFLGLVFATWHHGKATMNVPTLVLSFLLLLVALIMMVWLVRVRAGVVPAIVVGLAWALCGTVIKWTLLSPRTAVLLLAACIAVAVLPWNVRSGIGAGPGRRDWSLFVVAAVVCAVATVVGLAVGVGAVAGWVAAGGLSARRWRAHPWTPYAAVGTLVAVGAIAIRVSTGQLSWHRQPLAHVVSADFRAIAPDRVLYLTCVVALLAAIVAWRRPMIWYAAASTLTVAVIHLGRPGSAGFQDFFVIYPALLVTIAMAPWLTHSSAVADPLVHDDITDSRAIGAGGAPAAAMSSR